MPLLAACLRASRAVAALTAFSLPATFTAATAASIPSAVPDDEASEISLTSRGGGPREVTVVNDSLRGRTMGELHGGELTPEGYVPSPDGQESRAHLLYRLPRTVSRGYLEFEVKGLGGDPQDGFNHGGEPALLGMYDGRNLDEPVDYSTHFKNNFFRFVVKQRLAHRQIGVVFVSARPDASLQDGLPVWESVPARHFTTEEMINFDTPFDSARWHRVRVAWDRDLVRVLVDGKQIWSVVPPYPYNPVDHRLWLGSAPGIMGIGKYTAQRAGMIFRDLKVVEYSAQ